MTVSKPTIMDRTRYLVNVSDAKSAFAKVIRQTEGGDVLMLRYGKPVGMLVSFKRFEELQDELKRLEEQVAVLEEIP